MSTLTPSRTNDQRMTALAKGNRIRTLRAVLKEDIKYGKASAPDLIADPHADLLTMKVIDVLLAMPHTGRVKANKVLSQCHISPSKTMGGLTPRQRDEVVRLLAIYPARLAA